MKTKRWTRSPRGQIFGVATGLAEWRELDPSMTRLIVLLIVLFTGIFPGVAIYLALALILPMQTENDIIDKHTHGETIDVSFEEADEEYEDLKRKFDKEKDWDDRFRKGEGPCWKRPQAPSGGAVRFRW